MLQRAGSSVNGLENVANIAVFRKGTANFSITLSTSGRATVRVLSLNDVRRLELRRELLALNDLP
jgi:hypothetical protein